MRFGGGGGGGGGSNNNKIYRASCILAVYQISAT